MKKLSTNSSWDFECFLTPLIHSDNTQVDFVTVALCQPGGIAIIFLENWNFKLKIFWVILLGKNELDQAMDQFLTQI